MEQTNPPAAVTEKKLNRSERSMKRSHLALLKLLVLFALIWVLFFQVIGLMRMPSNDMLPRMSAGDLVLFYRLNKAGIRAQDVVVVEKTAPDSDEKQLFVCRVVAIGGDTVEITDNEELVVNGAMMIENMIYATTPRYEGFTQYPLTLAENQLFVLADAREGGEDSRYFGAVDASEIVGTVITVVRRNNI